MLHLLAPSGSRRLLLAFLLVAVAVLPAIVEAASYGNCGANGTSFYCPNCGGIEVDDCLGCDGFLNADTRHYKCFSRKLFNRGSASDNPYDHDEHYHYLWNDIVGAFVWFFAAGVATACGVGGGGIYVPLGILLINFAPKPASGLSQASIFGASLGGLILNLRNQHPNTKILDLPIKRDKEGKISLPADEDDPDADDEEIDAQRALASRYSKHSTRKYYTRPLIDYDMALFLAPMEMAGAVLGILIQAVLPNWLYLLLASIILGFTCHKTFKKFLDARNKEQAEAEKKNAAEERRKERESGENSAVLSSISKHTGDLPESVDADTNEEDTADADDEDNEHIDTEVDKEEQHLLRVKLLEEDHRQFPREKLIALLVLWVGLSIITFLKGGKGVESLIGITCKSPWYAVLIVCQFLWTLGFAGFFAKKLMKKQQQKESANYPFQPEDPVWDFAKVRFYASFTFLAGIVAGLIGIGGGMVLGPLMLVMGIHPRVSTATTATMIVLTSSSAAIIFVSSGLVPWSYAIFFFFVCLCGAYIGKTHIDGYVKKTGKASILILILATIIGLATLGCLVIVFTRLGKAGWCFESFRQFCYDKKDDGTCVGERLLSMIYSQ